MSQEKFDTTQTINNFLSVIRGNIQNEASIKMGFSLICINSQISGKMETYKYILVYPFFGEKYVNNYFNPFYSNKPNLKNENIFFEDFCSSVDISFYKYIFNEMWKYNNLVLFEICNYDKESWKIFVNHDSLHNSQFREVLIKINNEKEVLITESTFDEWYEKGEFNFLDFTIEIQSPNFYRVPFPLNPIILKINENNTFLQEI